jgi:hypothetical protein
LGTSPFLVIMKLKGKFAITQTAINSHISCAIRYGEPR